MLFAERRACVAPRPFFCLGTAMVDLSYESHVPRAGNGLSQTNGDDSTKSHGNTILTQTSERDFARQQVDGMRHGQILANPGRKTRLAQNMPVTQAREWHTSRSESPRPVVKGGSVTPTSRACFGGGDGDLEVAPLRLEPRAKRRVAPRAGAAQVPCRVHGRQDRRGRPPSVSPAARARAASCPSACPREPGAVASLPAASSTSGPRARSARSPRFSTRCSARDVSSLRTTRGRRRRSSASEAWHSGLETP